MSDLIRDLRFAARTLARQPALALASVATLALGIGANTAIFSVVNSALLTPPPFREPGRLVVAWASNPALARQAGLPDKLPVSTGDFYDWQRDSRSFSHLALVGADRMTLSGQGEPELLGVVRVSGDFSNVLGTAALLGRTLLPADDAPGKPAAVLLSYSFWQRRYAGDPGVVGRKVYLNNEPLTLVGVMPPRFAFPRGSEMPAGYGFVADPDAWVPMALPADRRQNRGSHNNIAIGRLRPGVGIAAAEKELRALCDRLAQAHADDDAGWSAHLAPITAEMVGNFRTALLLLWAAVGFVLLIACANVTNLLLARAASRQKEIAVRTAIGARRGRLVRQLLAESGLLAVAGGAVGVGLAEIGLRLLAAYVPADVAGAATYALDGRVLAFTATLCLVTSVLAGLVPALQMTRPDLGETLREGTRGGAASSGSRRTRGALVVAEVALAVLLLIGAGLLLRSFVRVLSVDPGFRPAHALAFEIDLPQSGITPPQRLLLFDRIAERLRSLPGVSGAAAVSELPLSGNEEIDGFAIEGRPMLKATDMVVADFRAVLPGYFETMGVALRRGRLLNAGDVTARMQVAVIDEGMAHAFWPGQDAIGKRFRGATSRASQAEDPANPWINVVGVVGSVRHSSLNADPRPQLYRLAAQIANAKPGQMPKKMVYVVRSSGDLRALAAAVRRAVHEVDPDQPVANVRTLENVVADSVAARRFNLLLLGLFAALALTLAAVGIYGITTYAVVQRTRELGLRMALGAQPGEVLRLLVAEAGALAGLGLGLGLAAAWALTRVMASLLYGVGSTDPLTYTAVAAVLLLIALTSAWVPGRRATQLDPMTALRAD
jgi:putative ABC transport system permease protein